MKSPAIRLASSGILSSHKNIITSWHNVKNIDKLIITCHDRDFNIIAANKTAIRILGLPSVTGSGMKCYTYYHGTESPPGNCPSCRCVLNREPAFVEFFEPHLNRFFQIRAFPEFDEKDEFVGLIHFVRDITKEMMLSAKGRG